MNRLISLALIFMGLVVGEISAFQSSSVPSMKRLSSQYSRVLRAEETTAETDSEPVSNVQDNFKGFGKKPKKKVKSKSQIAREKAASEYDNLAQSGTPEYNIFARPFGTEQWFPVGNMAIPRTAKVGDVIYNSEENLKQGAFRVFPNLAQAEVLEYGYNLKVFPDDEIKLASKSEAAKGNPVLGWVESLLNPIDSSNTKM